MRLLDTSVAVFKFCLCSSLLSLSGGCVCFIVSLLSCPSLSLSLSQCVFACYCASVGPSATYQWHPVALIDDMQWPMMHMPLAGHDQELACRRGHLQDVIQIMRVGTKCVCMAMAHQVFINTTNVAYREPLPLFESDHPHD